MISKSDIGIFFITNISVLFIQYFTNIGVSLYRKVLQLKHFFLKLAHFIIIDVILLLIVIKYLVNRLENI